MSRANISKRSCKSNRRSLHLRSGDGGCRFRHSYRRYHDSCRIRHDRHGRDLVGGVNAIVEGATDYQNNAVIISQCVNMGRVKADNASRIGGIVGHMQQYGIVKDCLNGGRYEGNSTKAGGIVGRGDSRFEAHNCLNVGDKWKDPLINSYGDFTSLSNLYYYGQPVIYENNSYLTNLSIDELCDPKKYKNWDINKTNSIWHVTESKGNFPVPFHSEMEEEIKE